MYARWYTGQANNFGDVLNPILLARISGKRVINARDAMVPPWAPVYSAIGSIIGSEWNDGVVVWGSGLLSEGRPLKGRPREILAVRGPRTRDALQRRGLPCPHVFGDPALLLPRFFPILPTNEFALGVIPHYVDRGSSSVRSLLAEEGALFIDILSGVHNVLNSIARCSMIASSSLHGLIVADAYGIPSAWVQFTEQIVGGTPFKFLDYFESVGKPKSVPLVLRGNPSLNQIIDRVSPPKVDLDLDRLLAACPFRRT